MEAGNRIPSEERLTLRPTKPGTLDLSAARLFIENVSLHATLYADVVSLLPLEKVVLPDGRSVSMIWP